jgi:hypothetical protein
MGRRERGEEVCGLFGGEFEILNPHSERVSTARYTFKARFSLPSRKMHTFANESVRP